MMSAHSQPSLSGRRVLVVEDEFFLADDLAQAVAQLGAEEALALLAAAGKVDLAVLDINLEDEAVFPVADVLAEQGVPFLFATGYDQASIPARYQHVPRWEKPFDPQSLAQVLPAFMRET